MPVESIISPNIAPSPPRLLPWAGIGLALLAVALLGGWIWRNDAWVYAENGPIEDIEVLINASAAILFAIRAGKKNDIVAAWCTVLAALLAVAAMREIQRCGVFAEVQCIPQEIKLSLTAVFPLIAGIALIWRRQNVFETLRPQWLVLFWPLIFTVAFFGIAQVIEKFDLVSYEEFFEFSGGLAALALAYWLLRRT